MDVSQQGQGPVTRGDAHIVLIRDWPGSESARPSFSPFSLQLGLAQTPCWVEGKQEHILAQLAREQEARPCG